jgi:hypothetical protein
VTRRLAAYALTLGVFLYLSYNTFVAAPQCSGTRCQPRTPSLYPVISWIDDNVKLGHARLLLSLYQSDRPDVR